MQIFIHRDDQEFGPYSLDQIKGLLTAGNVTGEDYCRVDGDTEWSTVSTRLAKLIPPRLFAAPSSLPPRAVPVAQPPLEQPSVTAPYAPSGQPSALIDLVGLPAYYQEEFQKIHASRETYQGKWNWAAFCFGSLWALVKGLWLSLLVSVIAGVAIGSVTCGVGAGPLLVIYWFIYGFRGNYMYYCAYVKGRQLPF